MSINPFEDYLTKVRAVIKENGFTVQRVLEQPGYAYTVGLSDPRPAPAIAVLGHDELDEVHDTHRLPELVLLGLPGDAAKVILEGVASRVLSGKLTIEADENVAGIFKGLPARFRRLPVDQALHQRLRVATALYGTYSAWQLLWPDKDGRFPGDPGADEAFEASQNFALLGARGSGPAH